MTQSASASAWDRRTEWPLVGAAVLFLVAYAWPILDPTLPSAAQASCRAVVVVTWGVFAVDYLVRWWIAPDRRAFFVRHLFDLCVVVLPVLRPLRMLRLVMLLRVVNRRAASSLHGRVVAYVVGGASLLAFVGALAVLDAERHASHANITSFHVAIWWAMTTMTTVGYGDHYPVTGQGQLAAVGLMIGGIALLGAVTATLASWLVDRVAEETTSNEHLRREIAALRDEVRSLGGRLPDIPHNDEPPLPP
jgi:voltage-gated potassium channel